LKNAQCCSRIETFEKCQFLFKLKKGEMLLESDEGQGAEFSDEVLLAKKIAFLGKASII
jgi:hypothetical protein